MNHRLLAIISVITTTLGILCYAYFNEWIIIRNPWENPYHRQIDGPCLHKKNILLFFWQHDRWHIETLSLRLTEQIQEQALGIVQAWLHEAFQSGFIHTPCMLEAALLDHRAKCLYLSFSTSPCDAYASTYTTLAIIESLLKTIAYNIPNAPESIQLMVLHTPLENSYIECIKPIILNKFFITHD